MNNGFYGFPGGSGTNLPPMFNKTAKLFDLYLPGVYALSTNPFKYYFPKTLVGLKVYFEGRWASASAMPDSFTFRLVNPSAGTSPTTTFATSMPILALTGYLDYSITGRVNFADGQFYADDGTRYDATGSTVDNTSTWRRHHFGALAENVLPVDHFEFYHGAGLQATKGRLVGYGIYR